MEVKSIASITVVLGPMQMRGKGGHKNYALLEGIFSYVGLIVLVMSYYIAHMHCEKTCSDLGSCRHTNVNQLKDQEQAVHYLCLLLYI